MSDNLSIDIDSGRAEASLNTVATGIERIIALLEKMSGATTGLDKAAASMSNLKLDPSVAASLKDLQDRLQNLSAARLQELQTQLKSIDPSNVNAMTKAIGDIQRVQSAIQSNNISAMNKALNDTAPAATGAASASNQLYTALKGAAAGMLGVNASILNAGQGFANIAAQSATASGAIGQVTSMFAGLGTAGAAIAALGLAAVFAGIAVAAVSLVSPIITATESMQRFVNAMDAVGGSGFGEKLFNSVASSANAAGVSLSDISNKAQQFAVAAQASGMSVDNLDGTFRKLLVGMRGMGASSAQINQAMNALTQMMSKGQVQAQELKIQLGNALPAAMGAAAEAAGTTTKGLESMARAGQLLPVDFVTKFADVINEKYGGAAVQNLHMVSEQLTILGNQFTMLAAAAGGGSFGLLSGLATILEGLNGVIRIVAPAIGLLAQALGTLLGAPLVAIGSAIKFVVGALENMGSIAKQVISNLMQTETAQAAIKALGEAAAFVSQKWTELKTYVAGAVESLVTLVGGAENAKAAIIALGIAIAGIAAVFGGWPAMIGAAVLYFGMLDNSVTKSSLAVKNFAAGSSGVSEGVAQMGRAMQSSTSEIAALATSFLSAETAARKDAEAMAALDRQHSSLKRSIADLAASKGAYDRSMRDSIRRLEEEKSANMHAIEAMEQRKQKQQELDKITGSSSPDMYTQKIKRMQLANQELTTAVQDTSREMQEFDDRLKSFEADALAQQQAIDKAREFFKLYGIQMTETTQHLVDMQLALGRTGKDAGEHARQIQRLTQSVKDLAAAAEEDAEAERKKIAVRAEIIAALQREQDAQKKLIDLQKQKPDGQQDKILIQTLQQLQGERAKEITQLQASNAAAVQRAMAEEALAKALRGEGDVYSNLKAAVDAYNQANGTAIDAQKVMSQNIDITTLKMKPAAEATQDLGDKAKKAGEDVKTQSDALGTASGNVSKFASEGAKATAKIDELGKSLGKVAEPINAMDTAVKNLNGALPTMVERLGELNGALDPVGTAFSTAAENAGTFKDSLEGFDGPVNRLIELMNKLTEAANKAFEAAQRASQAASSASSNGGDVPAQREGGYSGERTVTQSAHASAFHGAPHFAEGTTNTTGLMSKLPGGGIPSILHANEAVIPLSRGRKIPVELNQTADPAAATTLATTLASAITSSMAASAARTMSGATQVGITDNAANKQPARLSDNAPVDYATASPKPISNSSAPSSALPGKGDGGNVTVNMTINTPDANSFRKSLDQIQTETYKKMRTAYNRNG